MVPKNDFARSKGIAGHRIYGYRILGPNEVRVATNAMTADGPIETILPRRLANFLLRKLRRAQVEPVIHEGSFSITVRAGNIILEEYSASTAGQTIPERRMTVADKCTEFTNRWNALLFFEVTREGEPIGETDTRGSTGHYRKRALAD